MATKKTAKKSASEKRTATTPTFGVSENLQAAMNEEMATDRSNRAEAALLREYLYHSLRAEELKEFLIGCGYSMPGWDE